MVRKRVGIVGEGDVLVILVLIVLIGYGVLSANSTKRMIHVRLGTAIVAQSLPQVQLSSKRVYAYHNGGYCGKGAYQVIGDKYTFGCSIAVRIIPNPTPRPLPTVTPPPVTSCTNDQTCAISALALLNQERASHNIAPLSLDWTLTFGSSSCIGAKGHSVHMASTGLLAHDQFPADVCFYTVTAGENIGMGSGDEWSVFKQVNQEMLNETWTPGCQNNHHCNIDYPQYKSVGIGFAYGNGGWWVTEDFSG